MAARRGSGDTWGYEMEQSWAADGWSPSSQDPARLRQTGTAPESKEAESSVVSPCDAGRHTNTVSHYYVSVLSPHDNFQLNNTSFSAFTLPLDRGPTTARRRLPARRWSGERSRERTGSQTSEQQSTVVEESS
ncbi:hypothetical protein F2P81_017833 [Scophthalmus maximus]|uniref:Uncharacterized protein n=1 Tax=Scophthalmus maximus TaxID=52904 RepID=A0A6A4S916_SCOMX|nr:hypothetical protein F2P81_017833 [Scophthalmus maximus]